MADLQLKELHRFAVDGQKYALVVPDSAVYEVDDVTDCLLMALEEGAAPEEAVAQVGATHDSATVAAAMAEVKQAGWLTSKPQEGLLLSTELPRITTICLNVAHKCNMRCRYCYAGHGTYGGAMSLMTPQIACQAVDFLIEESQKAERCHIAFFGGEPLLNFKVIRSTVRYAKEQGEKHGKKISFGITTNGTLLTDGIVRFLETEKIGLMISIDGPKQVHDRVRVFRAGRGSYDQIVTRAQKVLGKRSVSARATITRQNLDTLGIMETLLNLGFSGVFLSPVSTVEDDYALSQQNMESIKNQNRILVNKLVECALQEHKFFPHLGFIRFLQRVHWGAIRVSSCYAGSGYVCIDPAGDIYVCHRFAGVEQFRMGNLRQGIDRRWQQEFFRVVNVNCREKCPSCWARYLCGGGCCHDHIFANSPI